MTNKKRPHGVQFLNHEDITAAIKEVAASAAKQGIQIALIGGVAMQAMGSRRLTSDVDIVALELLEGFRDVGPISFGGRHVLTSKGTEVDIIVRADSFRGLYEEALSTAAKMPGLPIPVISSAHLAAMKLAAARRKDENDLHELLIGMSNAQYKKTRRIVAKHLGEFGARMMDRERRQARDDNRDDE